MTYELFNNNDVDDIYICGDFNARIGTLNDSLFNEEIPVRKILDTSINQQGVKLVNFCNNVNCCVINGRVSTEFDDFTSIMSYKGHAVVDYHLTRNDNLSNINKMQVLSCTELVDKLKVQDLVSDSCHIPDHNLLVMEIETSMVV